MTPPQCIHGKETTERCIPCEHEALRGNGRGFVAPTSKERLHTGVGGMAPNGKCASGKCWCNAPVSNDVARRAREFREKRGHWGTHAEALCAEVERLHSAHDDLVKRHTALLTEKLMRPVETPALRPGELEQLRRIDQAARTYVDALGPHPSRHSFPEFEALTTALYDGRPAVETTAPRIKPGDRIRNSETGSTGLVMSVGSQRAQVQYDDGRIREPPLRVLLPEKASAIACGNPVMVNSEWYGPCTLDAGHEGDCRREVNGNGDVCGK